MKKKTFLLLLIVFLSTLTSCDLFSDNLGGKEAEFPYLCFTAKKAECSVKLKCAQTDLPLYLEYSTDNCKTWNDYYSETEKIILHNPGDKVYFRRSIDAKAVSFSCYNEFHKFDISGPVYASGNIMSLVDKSCQSKEIPNDYCFCELFEDCTTLLSAPSLPATVLKKSCYEAMFSRCHFLETIPALPATKMEERCYAWMFNECSNVIAFSETKSDVYPNVFRLPTSGNGTTAPNWSQYMFCETVGPFTGDPEINKSYYTNAPVIF